MPRNSPPGTTPAFLAHSPSNNVFGMIWAKIIYLVHQPMLALGSLAPDFDACAVTCWYTFKATVNAWGTRPFLGPRGFYASKRSKTNYECVFVNVEAPGFAISHPAAYAAYYNAAREAVAEAEARGMTFFGNWTVAKGVTAAPRAATDGMNKTEINHSPDDQMDCGHVCDPEGGSCLHSCYCRWVREKCWVDAYHTSECIGIYHCDRLRNDINPSRAGLN